MMEITELSRRAAAITQDEAFQAAVQLLKDRYTTAWRNTKPSQAEERDQLWWALQGVIQMEAAMVNLSAAPKVAAFNARRRNAEASPA
jgi:hypothetical protein